MNDPGYSKFDLTAPVKVGSKNTLDVYRVEQRLAYLGYPAYKTGTGSAVKEFAVNGQFGPEEQAALKLFEKEVRFRVPREAGYGVPNNQGVAPKGTVGNSNINNTVNGADGKISPDDAPIIPGDKTSGTSLDWLNAYNAPHWMNIGSQMQYKKDKPQPGFSIPGWNNADNKGEIYGVSWMRDLMVAQGSADPQYLSGLPATGSRFTAAIDGNGTNPGGHLSHMMGMSFDLSLLPYLAPYYEGSSAPESNPINTQSIILPTATTWNNASALALAGQLRNEQDPAHGNDFMANAMRNFLALYSVTRDAGTRANLPVVNGEAARSALFGDGTKGGSLIGRVIIGSNISGQARLQRMGDILTKLGIANIKYKGHQSHFHVDIQVPKIVKITPGPQKLLASADVTNVSFEENSMFPIDMTMQSVQEPPMLIAQVSQAAQQYNAVLGACQFVEPNDPMGSAINGIPVLGPVADYLKLGQNDRLFDVRVTPLDTPKHGTCQHDPNDVYPTRALYHYFPSPGYFGKDQMSFEVEANGKRFKVIFFVDVRDAVPEWEGTPPPDIRKALKWCPKPGVGYRISDAGNPADQQNQSINTLWSSVTLQRTSSLGVLIAAASNTTLVFADLPGGAVGETTGTSITLDTNAAGYGWYVDPNPASNADFLPTANPDVWMAKAGSAAAGKMDMLSVLLHEYGHALGLDHSVNPNDFMAPNLQPGERRLPSSAELAQLSQLSTALSSVGWASAQKAGMNSDLPGSPGNPASPALPVGTALSALLIGRLRRTDYGSTVPVIDSVQIPAPQFELAVNPTLTGLPSTGSGQATGWTSGGNVALNSSAGNGTASATLGENTTSDAHLSQTFMLKPGDRTLAFTIANVGMVESPGNGPLPQHW